MTKPQYKIEERSINDYTVDKNNANAGTKRGQEMIDESVEELGLARSITATRNREIPAGNKTYEAAANAGVENVIEITTTGDALVVVRREDWEDNDDEDARRYAWLDNQSGAVNLRWDKDELQAALDDGFDFDGVFTDWEIDDILNDGFVDDDNGATDEDKITPADEAQDFYNVQDGDIFQLDNGHILLCADNTQPAALNALFNSAHFEDDINAAQLLLTDPPYNVAEDTALYASGVSKAHTQLKNSAWDYGFDVAAFMRRVDDYVAPSAWAYVFTLHNLFGDVYDAVSEHFDKTTFGVWCKPNPMPSLSKVTWTAASELCVFGRRGRPPFNFPKEGHALNYWEIPKPVNAVHPTQKPIALFSHIIQHTTRRGDVVFDPFVGSGTALIASELNNRRCFAIEQDARFVAVALKRLADMNVGIQERDRI